MSNEALNWARSQPIGDAQGKGVLVALADRADKWGMCWPGVGRLVADTGKSDATVRRHLAKLAELDLIMVRPCKRSDGSHRSNEYCLVMGQSFELFFTSKATPPPITMTPPPITMTDHEPSENHQILSSLSLELDDLEKNSPRDLLCAAFEENFFEVLLSEEPRRQMLWLALPSETIADAIAQANDAPGNFRTALKHRLDVDSGVAGLRTKKSSAARPRREKPPAARQAWSHPLPGVEHDPDPDRVERERALEQRRVEAEREQTALLDDMTAAGVAFDSADSHAVSLYRALLAGDAARAEEVRALARRCVLSAQAVRATALARDGPSKRADATTLQGM